MANLIPTPIVNKNGVSTTVHKRATRRPSLKSLDSIRPVLNESKPKSRRIIGDHFLGTPTTVKAGGSLPSSGIIMRNPDVFESNDMQRGYNAYAWRRVDIEMTNGELYAYMRLGIDPVEAVALKGVGVSAEELPYDENLSDSLPGSLGRLMRGSKEHRIQNTKAVDAMIEAKIPALKAAKALESGLQDGHLNGRFDIKQLVDLFGKYKYGVAIGDHRTVESAAVVDSILAGDIPIELTKTSSRLELTRMEREFNKNKTYRTQIESVREAISPEDFIKIAKVGIKRVQTEQPVYDTYRLVQEHGEAVLDLTLPAVIEIARENDGPIYGLSGAQYLEEIVKMSDADTDIDYDDRYGDWQYQTMSDRDRPHDRRKVTMSGDDMMTMMDAGISADNAYDMMFRKGMSLDRILLARENNISMSIAEGML